VLSTTELETSAALAVAEKLARSLDADIRLLKCIIVPYPLDLDQPPVPSSFTIDRNTSLAGRSNLEMHVQICYCRDVAAALAFCLAARSLVVMGRKRKWWSRRENRLARLVRSSGHQLVIVDLN